MYQSFEFRLVLSSYWLPCKAQSRSSRPKSELPPSYTWCGNGWTLFIRNQWFTHTGFRKLGTALCYASLQRNCLLQEPQWDTCKTLECNYGCCVLLIHEALFFVFFFVCIMSFLPTTSYCGCIVVSNLVTNICNRFASQVQVFFRSTLSVHWQNKAVIFRLKPTIPAISRWTTCGASTRFFCFLKTPNYISIFILVY